MAQCTRIAFLFFFRIGRYFRHFSARLKPGVFTFFLHPAAAFFHLLCPVRFTLLLSQMGENSLFLQERNMSVGVIAGAVLVLLLLAYLIYALLRAEAF
jgi:K+-transporting ATPase KdpF subunit